MKFKAALFYQDALVFYSIYQLGDNYYKAKLDADALKAANPPALLELRKLGRQWNSDCIEWGLVKELGAAIDQRSVRH